MSLHSGIQKQRDDIPTRFFVEQLKDEWEIVLTGKSKLTNCMLLHLIYLNRVLLRWNASLFCSSKYMEFECHYP